METLSPHVPSPRLLIADDNDSLLQVLKITLSFQPWQVDYARDGDAALAAYQQAHAEGRPYDLLLLDNMMPGRSGPEMARAIRKADDWKTRIIIFTAYLDNIGHEDAISAGILDVWQKADVICEISARIAAVLQKEAT